MRWRASIARSRAVVHWSGSGSPEALVNVVCDMPSARARRVIIWANRSSLPPSNSPSADGGVVGRLGHHAQNRLLHRERHARHQPELGRLHRGGVRGNRHRRVERDAAVAQRLERHVEGHQLGEAGRMARRVGVVRLQDVAAGGIHHDGAVAVGADLRPGGRADTDRPTEQHSAGANMPGPARGHAKEYCVPSAPSRAIRNPHPPAVSATLRAERCVCPAESGRKLKKVRQLRRDARTGGGLRLTTAAQRFFVHCTKIA